MKTDATIDVSAAAPRELARRSGDGLTITLFWHPRDDTVTVEIWHAATGQTIAVAVPPEQALDAFHHPFAHLPGTGSLDERTLQHAC